MERNANKVLGDSAKGLVWIGRRLGVADHVERLVGGRDRRAVFDAERCGDSGARFARKRTRVGTNLLLRRAPAIAEQCLLQLQLLAISCRLASAGRRRSRCARHCGARVRIRACRRRALALESGRTRAGKRCRHRLQTC